MVDTVFGKKIDQMQKFLEDGTRIPVSKVWVSDLPVTMVKTQEKDGYTAIQVGFETRKKTKKSEAGHIRGVNLKKAPRFLREVRLANDSESALKPGDFIKPSEVLKPGDVIDVIGISKGKGFAGVVKRHHFKGGPRTHGQSDRERAPGSIGQTTTPGRVYKGKRMAGHMGHKRATIKNLQVLDVADGSLLIKGLIPGAKNSFVMVKKVGEAKKFVPLFKETPSGEIKDQKIIH